MNDMSQFLTTPHPAHFSVQDFIRMSEAGLFEKYAKAELIEGEIWVMNAIHSQHGRAQFQIGLRLDGGLRDIGSALKVYTAISVEMPDSLPEPDVVVAAANRGVMPLSSVALAVEISDSTLSMDLGRKAKLYAREGVPEYWVVDLQDEMVHRHSAAGAEGYTQIDQIAFGEPVAAVTLDRLVVESGELLD